MRRAVLVVLAAAGLAGCAHAEYQPPDADPVEIDAVVIDSRPPTDAPIDVPGSQCSRQPCSILPQCGCETNTAQPVCDLDFQNITTGNTKCRADNFHGTETTVCTMANTCGPAHVCVGRCRRYCDDDDDCPGVGGICIIKLVSGMTEIPGVTTCTTDCNPTAATNATCPATWGCHLARESAGAMRWGTDCGPPPQTGGTVGTACMNNNQCRPGLDCVIPPTGVTQCRPTCTCPGGNCAAGACPSGTGSCHPFTAPGAVVGNTTYGSCF